MDTETSTTEKPTAKKKAKKRRVKKAAVTKPPKAEGIYEGLTVSACCKGCNVDGCVISGKPYCAHPRKGGLHANDMQDSRALRRAQDAARVLGEQQLDARLS